MFDAVDAGLDSYLCVDCLGIDGDPQAKRVRLVDSRTYLFAGEVAAELDEVCPSLKLDPHGVAETIRTAGLVDGTIRIGRRSPHCLALGSMPSHCRNQ